MTTDTTRIPVTVHMQDAVLQGQLSQLDGKRLSDMLNDVSRYFFSFHNFLKLSYTKISFTNKQQEIVPIAYVNILSVRLAVLSHANMARGLGIKQNVNSLPFTPKLPVPIELVIPDYILSGNTHCAAGQEAFDVVSKEPLFLPLTEVSLQHLGNGTTSSAAFAAVNKQYIMSFHLRPFSIDWQRVAKAYGKLVELKAHHYWQHFRDYSTLNNGSPRFELPGEFYW